MAAKKKPQNRTKAGQFKKGVSGNPGGRPKLPDDLKTELRKLCPKVLRTWSGILGDESAKGSDRIKAGELIMSYAYGKPPQAHTGNDGEGPIRLVVSYTEDWSGGRDSE